jgi:peptide/nickel transport system permease protein
MNWWQKLKKNPLARLGALLLLIFYVAVIAADFVAPYDAYASQPNGSLLPPTPIYWRNQEGQFIGPHVYPTTQGPTDLETGDRKLFVDRSKPSPIRFFVKDQPINCSRFVYRLDKNLRKSMYFQAFPQTFIYSELLVKAKLIY